MVKQFKKSLEELGITKEQKLKESMDYKETIEECNIFLYFLAQNLTNFVDMQTILQTEKIPNQRIQKELTENSDHWTQILKDFKREPSPKLPVMKFNLDTVEPHSLNLPEYMK